MMTVEQERVVSAALGLPTGVQGVLGELAGAAKDGLLALSVGLGLGVLGMMEAGLDGIVGSKHAKSRERTAVRHGHEDGGVTLGGRRVAVRRPRARTVDGEQEVPLASYEYFADRDLLTRVVLEQMLAGVSTRRFTRTREPVCSNITPSFTDVPACTRPRVKVCVGRALIVCMYAPCVPVGLSTPGKWHESQSSCTTPWPAGVSSASEISARSSQTKTSCSPLRTSGRSVNAPCSTGPI